MREKGLASLDYFNSEILGYGKPPYNLNSACHRPMNEWLQDVFTQPKQVSLWNAPRGCGKSLLGGVGHTLWRGCRNPNITIRYVHADEKMASEIMAQIRGHLEANGLLLELFEKELIRPTIKQDYYGKKAGKADSDETIFFNRTYAPRTASLRMLGYKTGRIGTHVDLFVLDDLVNNKTTATALLMESVKDFIRQLPPLLNDQQISKILVLGTRWDPGDAWGMLQEDEEWKDEVRALVQSCYTDTAETVPLWPEKFPVDVLLKMEQKMTRFFFSANMRNEPIPRGSQLFDVEKVKRYTLELDAQMRPKIPTDLPYLVYTAVDPNRKDDGSGDNAAVLTVARDSEGNHFVLDLEHGNNPNSIELTHWIRQAVQRWKPISVLYEAMCGQRLLIPWLKRDMLESGVVYPLHESKRPFGIGKPVRIRALAAIIETGKLWVPNANRFTPLLKEIEHYTGASKVLKDDCLDCLADIYSDGFDASGGGRKKAATVEAPWQNELLDGMIGTYTGMGAKRPRVTCTESLRRWR